MSFRIAGDIVSAHISALRSDHVDQLMFWKRKKISRVTEEKSVALYLLLNIIALTFVLKMRTVAAGLTALHLT